MVEVATSDEIHAVFDMPICAFVYAYRVGYIFNTAATTSSDQVFFSFFFFSFLFFSPFAHDLTNPLPWPHSPGVFHPQWAVPFQRVAEWVSE